jgi:hypothetical protein
MKGVSPPALWNRKITSQRRRPMNDPNEVKAQSQALFDCLKGLYGVRFSPETQNDLRSAVETVVKTIVALRSVKMDAYGDPSLPFTPFRKEE